MKMKTHNAKRNIAVLIFIAVIFLFFVWEDSPEPANHRFFPRSQIGDIYRTYLKSATENVNMTPEELGYIRDAEVYYQSMSNCSIIGTLHQEQIGDLVMGFDIYPPDLENEKVSILKDYGTIKYDMDMDIYPKSKDFDFFVCQYNERDLLSRELLITSTPRTGEFILGYLWASYESPSGKGKIVILPLNGSDILLPTKEGRYPLKEFCVFQAYEPIKKFPEVLTKYYLKIDGQEVFNFSIP